MRSWRRCSERIRRGSGHYRHTLIDVVAEPRLDRGNAEVVLNSDDGQEAIKEAEGLSRRFRVEGVPFFIISGKITLAGAQQPDAFIAAFRQAVVQN
jgi:predicted DsbA family dithiol-disulfide isomerase